MIGKTRNDQIAQTVVRLVLAFAFYYAMELDKSPSKGQYFWYAIALFTAISWIRFFQRRNG